MKYTCSKCGKPAAFLLEGGLCKGCYLPNHTGDVPKEKRSFDNRVNDLRKQIRIRKAVRAGTVISRPCEWCGIEFYTMKRVQRFCCESCKSMAQNERYKERKAK